MKQRAEESHLETTLEMKCSILRAGSVLLTAWELDKKRNHVYHHQHFTDTTKLSQKDQPMINGARTVHREVTYNLVKS